MAEQVGKNIRNVAASLLAGVLGAGAAHSVALAQEGPPDFSAGKAGCAGQARA